MLQKTGMITGAPCLSPILKSSCTNKIENKKYNSARTIQKIFEKEQKSISLAHIYMITHFLAYKGYIGVLTRNYHYPVPNALAGSVI